MSAVELLQNYSDRLPVEQRGELMEDVRSSTLRMSSMMEQVLVLGRAEAGKLDFRVAPLEVEIVARKLVGEILRATLRPAHRSSSAPAARAGISCWTWWIRGSVFPRPIKRRFLKHSTGLAMWASVLAPDWVW